MTAVEAKRNVQIQPTDWNDGDLRGITDLQIRLNCADIAARSKHSKDQVDIIAQRIYNFVTDKK